MIGRPGPWTTEADRAELHIAVWELLAMIETHDACAACAEARARTCHYHCEPVGLAIDAVVEWWERRNLLSKAQFLRALQTRRAA